MSAHMCMCPYTTMANLHRPTDHHVTAPKIIFVDRTSLGRELHVTAATNIDSVAKQRIPPVDGAHHRPRV